MKANKITVTIVVEGLSIDIVRAQLSKVVHEIENEHVSGSLYSDDGDSVEWKTESKPIEF